MLSSLLFESARPNYISVFSFLYISVIRGICVTCEPGTEANFDWKNFIHGLKLQLWIRHTSILTRQIVYWDHNACSECPLGNIPICNPGCYFWRSTLSFDHLAFSCMSYEKFYDNKMIMQVFVLILLTKSWVPCGS